MGVRVSPRAPKLMQWRNGNAMSCNLVTSGFDSRLHVQDRPRSIKIALVAQPEEQAVSTREVRGSSPRESANLESEREGSRAPPAKRSVPHGMSIVRSALRHAVMV